MKYKDFLKENEKYAVKTNSDVLSWVFKNKKLLKDSFKKKHPRSKYDFRATLKTLKDTNYYVFSDGGEVAAAGVNNSPTLEWKQLRKLGCPSNK